MRSREGFYFLPSPSRQKRTKHNDIWRRMIADCERIEAITPEF